jgi:hypothetical protein
VFYHHYCSKSVIKNIFVLLLPDFFINDELVNVYNPLVQMALDRLYWMIMY